MNYVEKDGEELSLQQIVSEAWEKIKSRQVELRENFIFQLAKGKEGLNVRIVLNSLIERIYSEYQVIIGSEKTSKGSVTMLKRVVERVNEFIKDHENVVYQFKKQKNDVSNQAFARFQNVAKIMIENLKNINKGKSVLQPI